jgi:hypothetical protein
MIFAFSSPIIQQIRTAWEMGYRRPFFRSSITSQPEPGTCLGIFIQTSDVKKAHRIPHAISRGNHDSRTNSKGGLPAEGEPAVGLSPHPIILSRGSARNFCQERAPFRLALDRHRSTIVSLGCQRFPTLRREPAVPSTVLQKKTFSRNGGRLPNPR